MPSNSRPPKILIIDAHNGAACFMHALFKEMGMEAEVLSDMIVYGDPRRSIFGCNPYFFGPASPVRAKPVIVRLFYLAMFILRNPISVIRHSVDYWRGRLWRANITWRNYIRYTSYYLFGDHFRYRGVNMQVVDLLLRMPRWRKFFSQFDVLVGSFPPMVFQFIKRIADEFDQRLILNMGHRFNIFIPQNKEYNENLKKELLELIRDERHAVGAMTRYDQLYTHHYLSKLDDSLTLESVPLLGAKAFYIPMRAKKAPASNVALVTPMHANRNYNTLPLNIEQMNQSYEKFCLANKTQATYVFKSMREHWPGSYSYEDLGAFAGAAVVNFAYSSYSFSGLEVYDCNVPFFYADEEFLIRHNYDNDYRMFPVYANEAQYQNMEADIDDPDSPNGRSIEARRAWLRHSENHQRQNAIAFSDYDDLFAKMHEAAPRYAEISRAMHKENTAAREAMLQAWRRLLEGGEHV